MAKTASAGERTARQNPDSQTGQIVTEVINEPFSEKPFKDLVYATTQSVIQKRINQI